MSTTLQVTTTKRKSDIRTYHLPPSVQGEGTQLMADNYSAMPNSEAKLGAVDQDFNEYSRSRNYAANAMSPGQTSSHSLEEVFGTHFDDGLKTPTMNSPHAKSPSSDDWFNGDSDILSKQDRDDGQVQFTAPISLYMPNGVVMANSMNTRSSNHSLDSSGRQTPLESVSGNGSLGSRGSTPSNSVPRPLLYSAIGSLESSNPASFGSLSKRLSAAVGVPKLLPPVSTTSSDETWFRPSLISPEANRTNSTSRFGATHLNMNGSDSAITVRKGNKSSKPKRDKLEKSENESKKGEGDNAKNADTEKNSDNTSKPSNFRRTEKSGKSDRKKRVSYDRRSLRSKKQVEMFRPSSDAYTPRIGKKSIKYKEAEKRTPVQTMATPMGTLQRPNFRDALRRVAMIMHQHIVKIERRFEQIDARNGERGLFTTRMRDAFSEENFRTPTYKCTMVRIPMARPGMVFGLRQIKTELLIPSEEDIYEFAHQLFNKVQLSSECSIVCLIYVERLMQTAKVPLLACTWRPIFMCGLLLASKVWQDLSSWNIEFASVYPEYSLDAINKLEVNFLRNIKWDLYISSTYVFSLQVVSFCLPCIEPHTLLVTVCMQSIILHCALWWRKLTSGSATTEWLEEWTALHSQKLSRFSSERKPLKRKPCSNSVEACSFDRLARRRSRNADSRAFCLQIGADPLFC
eukprot:scaffold4222_cov115-Cylindrotheca_fusiformis.AAC.6